VKKLFLYLLPLVSFIVSTSTARAFFSDTSEAAAKAIKPLIEQNQRVLTGRIYKILEARFTNLKQCPIQLQETLQQDFAALPAYSEQRAVAIQALNLYLRSYKVEPRCLASLNKNEQAFHRAERQKFAPVHFAVKKFCPAVLNASVTGTSSDRDCGMDIPQFFADLDPHCVSLQVPNPNNLYDPFPCMAGDYLVGKAMVNKKTWRSFLLQSQTFLENFREALNDPKASADGVDLYKLYLQDNPDRPDLRESFLAEIDFYFSSFHSSSSYIRGFHNHIWTFVLFETGSAEKTLDYFNTSRLIVDQFRTLNNWADQQRIPLNLHGIGLKDKNRHNYMAAYLACHYREQGRLFHESLPIMLGYAYETLDLKSHLLVDHDSWDVAYRSFKVDTDRYKTGSYWGRRFCTMKL
jgi:hypothetical protein